MNEQQNEWKVVRTKEWAAQTAEIAKLRAEVPALDANSKYWFDMNKAAAAELAMVKALLVAAQAAQAAFIDLKYRHASSSSKIANLNGIIAQKQTALDIRNRELEAKNDALGNAQAELKQYKARNECATAALQGKGGQYQLQEIAKPKPASQPLPYMGIDWASPPSYGVPSWLDPVASGVRS